MKKWLRKTPTERFWDSVRKGPQCWEWTGPFTNGHGITTYGGRTWHPHRLAYMLTFGPIPRGAQMDHLCKNTRCVRPDHLEAVTASENMRRRSWSAGRRRNRHRELMETRGTPVDEDRTLWDGLRPEDVA